MLRTTYTYTTLEIDANAFDHILAKIRQAGEEYVKRYYEVQIAEKQRVIHFARAEVALVTPLLAEDSHGPGRCSV